MNHWVVYHKGTPEVIALQETPDATVWERVAGPFDSREKAETHMENEKKLWESTKLKEN
jgi:hypothetical protein